MQLSKNDSLALKGIAILMMYVHHFYLSPDRWAGYAVDFFPLTADMTVYIAEFFKTCVCIFVFITGYGMTPVPEEKSSGFQRIPSGYSVLPPAPADLTSFQLHLRLSAGHHRKFSYRQIF